MEKADEIEILQVSLSALAKQQSICGVESKLIRSILLVLERERIRLCPPMPREEAVRRIEMSLEDIRARAEYLAGM
jgi:hypothetical protein